MPLSRLCFDLFTSLILFLMKSHHYDELCNMISGCLHRNPYTTVIKYNHPTDLAYSTPARLVPFTSFIRSPTCKRPSWWARLPVSNLWMLRPIPLHGHTNITSLGTTVFHGLQISSRAAEFEHFRGISCNLRNDRWLVRLSAWWVMSPVTHFSRLTSCGMSFIALFKRKKWFSFYVANTTYYNTQCQPSITEVSKQISPFSVINRRPCQAAEFGFCCGEPENFAS